MLRCVACGNGIIKYKISPKEQERELLGRKITNEQNNDEITEQLVRMNEHLTRRNKRTKTIIKVIVGIIIGFFVLNILLTILGMVNCLDVPNNMKIEVQEIIDEENP